MLGEFVGIDANSAALTDFLSEMVTTRNHRLELVVDPLCQVVGLKVC